ncbi:receptor-like protein kinase 4 [Zea mays]|uniref:Receptor-like protein kinase 4 n=1 Tax=Zea mays TaxID=4577 RepID=A0A1D6M0N7_MAIZE|nr:receptor-like protein kinase 4 [Zea mays]
MYTSLNESSSRLTFVSLDISGQIKMNVWSHALQSWQAIYSQPADPCTPYATCGAFTTCNGGTTSSSSSFCDCMPGFSRKSPQDWELDDRAGGCVRNTPLHYCTTTSEKNATTTGSTDIFLPIPRVTLPYNHLQSVDGAAAASQSDCEEACRASCSCTAYSYNSSRCSVWHGELFSVNRNDGIDNNSEQVLYLRLASDDSPPGSAGNRRRKPSAGVVAAASIVGGGLLLVLILLLTIWRKRSWRCGTPLYGSQGGGGGVVAFRYTDLSHATKNFSEKLGAGGFGCVFKGVLTGGSTAIAVKRLDGAARQGEKQFRAESDGAAAAAALGWNTRYQIAIGVARGLSYLHQSCRECIIHCDIKPENILLDASFAPKIADFGMAAFVGRDFSRVLTTFRGTAGYLAPEWLGGVAITSKVDVYSFGLVLLEIVSGRRNSPEAYSSDDNYHIEYFPVRAIGKLHGGDVRSLVDPQLHGDFDLEEVERVCKVACWCIQDNELHRPTMGEVVRVLEGQQEIDMPPMPRLLAAITQGTGTVTEGSSASSM